MARPRLVHIPFTEGQREDIDKKLLPAGYLSRVKNMRLRKDGRWGVRYGDTAVALTTNLAVNLTPRDLVSFDGRLFAIGSSLTAVSAPLVNPSSDLHEYVNQDQFAWKATGPGGTILRLGQVTGVLDMGRPASMAASIAFLDVAAANGVVCLVYEAGGATVVHIFVAETDATLLYADASLTRPRVVAIGDAFFIGGISGTGIDLYSFDPATDTALQAETAIFGSGDTVVHWDLTSNVDGDGAWAVVHRNTPTTSIAELDSAGAVDTTFSGPSVDFDFVTICQTPNRVNLVAVVAADSTVDLYSYTLAGSLDPGAATTLFSGRTTTKQAGACNASEDSTDYVTVYAETAGSPGNNVESQTLVATTHVSPIDDSWNESTLTTKPAAHPERPLLNQVFGGVQSEGTFAGNFLGSPIHQHISAYKDRFEAGAIHGSYLPAIARDTTTGAFYWPNLVEDTDGRQRPVVTAFQLGSTARRHTVDMGGAVYLFGGAPQSFDGRQLMEAGYQETPVIHNIAASNSAGSLPSSTTINVAVKWEWYDSLGRKGESPLSEVETVTMGATDDTITFTASVPHSWRCNASSQETNLKVVAYRSLSGRKQLRRALVLDVATFGDDVSFTLEEADASIAANEVVYTQGGRGALGDILEHESPRPADYGTRMGKRILSAGLPNPFEWQVSKPEFPNEPINWSGDTAFRGTIPERIYGVAALDTQAFLFGRKRVFTFAGEGPDETGQGRFSDPIELPGALGLHDANSIVETPIGIMYQADEEKLAIIPRGGSSPEWFGQAVRDTVRAFPKIKAAAVLQGEQLVTFACNNAAETDGRLIHYDLRANVWIVDEFDGSAPITAIAEHEGRLAKLSEGVITLENTTHPPASFIAHGLTTGPLVLPQWGKLVNVTLLAEFRGNCILTCYVSYDDGKTWTTLKAYTLSTANGLVAGDTVRRQWWPRRRKGDRFMFDFQATALSGAASEGLVMNACTVALLDKQGETRLPAGQRG